MFGSLRFDLAFVTVVLQLLAESLPWSVPANAPCPSHFSQMPPPQVTTPDSGPPTGVNAHACFFHSNAPSESGPAHVVFSLLPVPKPRPEPHQAELLGDTTGAVCVIRAYVCVSTVYTEQKEKGRRREEEQGGREGENKTQDCVIPYAAHTDLSHHWYEGPLLCLKLSETYLLPRFQCKLHLH